MESLNPVELIEQYGFTTVAIVAMGYFVYFVWKYVNEQLNPKLEEMHKDMIRLQEKVKVVLEYRERQKQMSENKNEESKK